LVHPAGQTGRLQVGKEVPHTKKSIDLLHWATRARDDISLREYTGSQVDEFISADQLDEEAQKIVDRFSSSC
jgi:hypothetical protein